MAQKAKPGELEEEPEAQAEIQDEPEEEAAAPSQKLPIKLIAIVAAALMVLGAGGSTAYFLFDSGSTRSSAVGKPVFVDLPEVLVNLSNTGSDRVQYLKIKVVLELSDQALIQQIQPVMPRVMDAFQTYLRELRPTDLEGSAAIYRLKEELVRRVNVAIAPSRINAVLFKEMVVQ
jgi:flagellar FliL protein